MTRSISRIQMARKKGEQDEKKKKKKKKDFFFIRYLLRCWDPPTQGEGGPLLAPPELADPLELL